MMMLKLFWSDMLHSRDTFALFGIIVELRLTLNDSIWMIFNFYSIWALKDHKVANIFGKKMLQDYVEIHVYAKS